MTDREFDFSGPPPPDFGESLRALCFDFARQPDTLWVDDARDPPDDTWQVARSAPEAVAIILDRVYEKASMKKTKKTKDKFVSWKALLRHMEKMEQRAKVRADAARSHILSPDELQAWAAKRGVEVAKGTEIAKARKD